MISMGKWEARSIASLDLPDPVAPMITSTLGLEFEPKFECGLGFKLVGGSVLGGSGSPPPAIAPLPPYKILEARAKPKLQGVEMQ